MWEVVSILISFLPSTLHISWETIWNHLCYFPRSVDAQQCH